MRRLLGSGFLYLIRIPLRHQPAIPDFFGRERDSRLEGAFAFPGEESFTRFEASLPM
jgi:hypothetical protein